MLEFIRELRDLCDKHLAAEEIGDAPAPATKKSKKAEKVEVESEDAPITQDDVRSALINYSKKHGKENTFKLLLSFGAKTVSEVKAKDFREILGKAGL